MRERLLIPGCLQGRVWRYAARGEGRAMPAAHTHADLEFNLVVRGRARYLMERRRYELGARSLAWLFPGQPHLLVQQSRDFEMWIAVFRPGLVRRAAAGPCYRVLRASRPPGTFCKPLAREDAAWLAALLREAVRLEQDPVLCNALLRHLLLAAWDRFRRTEAVADHALVHPAVEAAARLLQETEPSPALPELAARVHLSPARLSRLFRRQVGTTISRFRNRVRVERFLRLYGSGQRTTMLAAAYEAGFGSYAQFHRVFKETMGLAPRAYAAQVREE